MLLRLYEYQLILLVAWGNLLLTLIGLISFGSCLTGNF